MNPLKTDIEAPRICTFNVGGERFSFSRETLEASGQNFLSIAVSRVWAKSEEVFIDADPKIFQKWIAPYIRSLLLPDLDSIKDGQEKNRIIATANTIGLTVILEHINPAQPKLTEQVFLFGPDQWREHYGEVGEVPTLPKNINEILKKPCPFRSELKIRETHILFFIPEKVNGKELSINAMEELAKNPKKGNPTGYKYIWGALKAVHGNTEVGKSSWVLMSKEVLEQSRGKNRATQIALARSDLGHQVPTLLEAIVCNFVHFAATGKGLFCNSPWRYTCCQEQTNGYKLVVGGFAPAGLGVDCYDDFVNVGVAPVLRLF